MKNRDQVFSGPIPELYDAHLVPMIFESYAEDLANRVVAGSPKSVLETAAGTGVVTRNLAPCLGSESRYVVTDLNQAMLNHASMRQGQDCRIIWQQADALNLPFEDASFDVVVCQFGVMFFPDKVSGFAEARRVLKHGGFFIFNVWDHIGANEFADEVTRAAAAVFPENPPLFMARTPHGYHRVSTIREDLAAAGFSKVTISTVAQTSAAPSANHVAIAFCQGTPMRNEINDRAPSLLGHVTEQAADAITKRFGQGPIMSKIQAHIVTAVS